MFVIEKKGGGENKIYERRAQYKTSKTEHVWELSMTFILTCDITEDYSELGLCVIRLKLKV
jgi:hypothetical protein